MSLECGSEILLRDVNGANLTRFIWLCRGRWVALQRDVLPLDHPLHVNNGMQGDWRWVISYLMRAAKLSPQGHEYYAASGPGKTFTDIRFGPVIRVADLAALVGMPAADVRAELADYVLSLAVPEEITP